jgi:hypothetical protein
VNIAGPNTCAHHLIFRPTQPDEVVRRPQFQRALDLVRPPKTKLVHVAQQKIWFALLSLTHYALNNDEPRNQSRFPFANVTAACADA